MKKILHNLVIILVIVLLKSCTYSLNIDTKLFVSGIGVDVNDEGDFSLSFSYPDISEFSPESSKIKGDGSVCGFGKTFYEAVEDIVSKTHKTVDLEHVKVVTISSKVLNNHNNFERLLDYLSHNSQISRRVYVCASDGEAHDFINFKTKSGEHSQVFISELIEHNSKENGINLVTLNNLLDYFSQNKSILLPVLKLNNDKSTMYISGSYVFDNYKLVEEINLKDTMIINFLRGDSFKILNDFKYQDNNIDFEAQNIDRKIKISDYGNVSVALNFNLKTKIKNCLDSQHRRINSSFINDIKNILDKDIYNNCVNLVDRFYKNGIDILNFENHIYKFNTNIWRNNINEKQEWMNKLEVRINIDNNIVNIGNISF